MRKILQGCQVCQEGNEHAQNTGLYLLSPALENIWLDLSMNFELELSRIRTCRGSILVLVDRFSKMAYLLTCKKTEDAGSVAHLFF